MSTQVPSLAASRETGSESLRNLLSFCFIVAQVVLLGLTLRAVDLGTPGFRLVFDLATVGFVVHHYLSAAWRLRFFVGLSIASIFLVLGAPNEVESFWDPALAIPRGGTILIVGLLMVSLCRLRTSLAIRTGLLLVAAVILGLLRQGYFDGWGLEVVWILLAAMFMFRTILYLYDTATSPETRGLSHALAYFFLLPGSCFVLFPVIDFKTFCRCHYNEEALVIYQRGLRRMVRGVIQLLLYRYVDQVLSRPTTSVHDGITLFWFLISTSLLYLNVSGQFHLITGLLLLFGFNLPETNQRYFFASSFTDYWRRVNIYWKDFMMKCFFYPTYFRLKGRGATVALVGATLVAFFATWVLHLYQTWWLKGTFAPSWPDSLFWIILCILVVANGVWELKRGRSRRLIANARRGVDDLRVALHTAGTYLSICLLWSLWSSPTLGAWLGLWPNADWRTVAGMGMVSMGLGFAAVYWERWLPATVPAERASRQWLRREWVPVVVPLALLCLVAQPAVRQWLTDLRPRGVARLFKFERVYDVLEAGDSMVPERKAKELNYYKRLLTLDEGNRQLLESMVRQRIPRVATGVGDSFLSITNDRVEELRTNFVGADFESPDFRTSRWGMRDRDCTLEKPSHTVRFAMLGSSHVMGYGVPAETVFETLVEDRLNREGPLHGAGVKFEILNFAQAGYSPLQNLSLTTSRVVDFQPDILILVGHTVDFKFINVGLRRAARRRIDVPYDLPQEILRKAKIEARIPDALAEKRLRPFEPTLMKWALQELALRCREKGILPVYVYLPLPGVNLRPEAPENAKAALLLDYAKSAGFTVIDLTHVFDAQDSRALMTGYAPHCNVKAHALIADALYQALLTEPQIALARRARGLTPSAEVGERATQAP